MVMFRDYVTRTARAHGIFGTVKNNADGTVSIAAEAEEIKLRELINAVYRGPFLSRVDHIAEKWSDPLGGYKNFDILY